MQVNAVDGNSRCVRTKYQMTVNKWQTRCHQHNSISNPATLINPFDKSISVLVRLSMHSSHELLYLWRNYSQKAVLEPIALLAYRLTCSHDIEW